MVLLTQVEAAVSHVAATSSPADRELLESVRRPAPPTSPSTYTYTYTCTYTYTYTYTSA
jgi:hypothetical protein